MNTLGKYCHDFPRLAKESGYMFQLYRGRINWSELDKVNVQDIVDERNFQLLEQNLIHVINCNLEREYDVKILDQNFVKLFKLAQLGIDYLSYCELYLDRCVILLQEQLANCQEECGLLREEIEKKGEELKKSKKKAKIQSQKYKCNKCSKLFLNETYLDSHERRRHKNASQVNENKQLFYSDQAQQTDAEKVSISVFTQTIDFPTPSTIVKDLAETNGTEILKRSEQEVKIDNLKRDLEELKIRLTLAEKIMQEKKNDERTYPGSFPSAMIPVIHSYISPCNGHAPILSTTPAVVPTVPKQPPVSDDGTDTSETHKNQNKLEYELNMFNGNIFRQTNGEDTPRQKLFTPERVPAEGASTVRSGSVNSNEMFGNIYEGLKDNPPHTPPQQPYATSDNNIMDVRPKADKKPLENEGGKRSLPSKPKPQIFLEVENLTNDFPATISRSSPVYLHSDLKIDSESASESLDPRTSTPVNDTLVDGSGKNDTKWDTETMVKEERQERRRKSPDSPVRGMNLLDGEGKSNSLFRKIIKKKSPKIQELTVNLRNSFSQLYGSVSSVGKKNLDEQPCTTSLGKTKSDIIEGLHTRLKALGIDPEWSGIPKETMKQKLNILEHNRNLLSKERRLYPYLRRKLQKHVLKKLKSRSPPSKGKARFSAESLESIMGEPSGMSTENVIAGETSEITIYDSDGDSDMEVKPIPPSAETQSKPQNISLDSIEPIKLGPTSPGEMKWGEQEREMTDFSIFQAGRFKSSTVKAPQLEMEKSKGETVVDELETDSDFDDEFIKELERESVHYTPDKSPRKDIIASFPAKAEENVAEESSRSAKTEGQSILKSEIDKSQLMSKKKVLFAEEPEIFETTSKTTKYPLEKQKIFDLSSIADDDDDWSIESEWTVNKAP